jgi:predicted Zn-dependent protease
MAHARLVLLLFTLSLTACIDGPPKAGQPTMAELAARQPYQPQPLPPKAQAAEDAERAALAARPLAELLASSDEADRFLGLPEAIRQALAANQLDAAEAHARALIKIIPHFAGHPRYGDAIFLSHQALGKIALRRNDQKTALAELIASTNTPGSDRLTHGPIPMDLARALVDLGHRKAVAHFLDRCSHFNLEKDKLIDWGILLRKGINPDLVPY